MSDTAQDRPTRGPEPPAHDRLESWKEIAAYLGKDVSTVRRWSKRAGLPVYHHAHDKVRNVYASRSELDAWQNQYRGLPDDGSEMDGEDQAVASVEEPLPPQPTSTQVPRWWTRWPAVAAGIVVLAVLAGSVAWLAWRGLGQPADQLAALDVSFHQGDYVLISRFENLTGNALFDGTVEYALERELSNSGFVRVVPPERVEDALRLMKLPVETVVNAAVGREVALRDGGIRVVLTGRIEQLGPSYVLTVQLLDPQDGRVLASVSEDARGEGAIIAALRRQARQVRARLGEALPLIEASEQRLEKVTTPSLRALRRYSQGYAQYRDSAPFVDREGSGMSAAAELFRQAIAEDPQFASAHNMLGWSIWSQGRPREEYLPHFERAVDLSESTTERDRLFLEGSYYSLTEQHDLAIPKYEALLRLHPDHYYAANNLHHSYQIVGRPVDRTRLTVRRADLRPNDMSSQVSAAWALSRAWQLDRAKVYVKRASALLPSETPPQLATNRATGKVVWVHFFPAYEHWFRGELAEAVREVEAVAQTIPARSPSDRDAYSTVAGSLYLAFGRLRNARALFESLADTNLRHIYLAWLAICLDDEEDTRAQLSALPPGPVAPLNSTFLPVITPLRVVRAGLELERVDVRDRLGGEPPVGYWELAWGELALRRGETAEAIDRIERGLELTSRDGTIDFYLGSESLATAWQRLGNETQALRVLEDAAQLKARYVARGLGGAFGRFRVQARLAREYRKLGRVQEAEAIEAELLRMLTYADADHPIVRQIRESQGLRPHLSDTAPVTH